MEQFNKEMIYLRGILIGGKLYKAARALEFASQHHTGTRKDGVTPEYQHQLSIAHLVRSLGPSLLFLEETLASVFLHDTLEDCEVSRDDLLDEFGVQITDAVCLLTKKSKFMGFKKEIDTYYEQMAACPIASIVKGADRAHNILTMPGVFSEEKMISYMIETEDVVLPMLKAARRNFPAQELA